MKGTGKKGRRKGEREKKESPSSGMDLGNKLISRNPIDNIYVQVAPSVPRKQQEKKHFMDPKVCSAHFISTQEKSALKIHVCTSVKRGTTCCFAMTVFPSSIHQGVKPLPSPSLRQLATRQPAAHRKQLSKAPKSTGEPPRWLLKCDTEVHFQLPRDKHALCILQGSLRDVNFYC